MNFLSHFYFHQTKNDYFNLGLILPDLVKTFCQKHLHSELFAVGENEINLSKGVKTHLKVDQIYHNSEVFIESNHLVSQLFSDAKWPRKWFLNHILIEICLDRALMELNENLCKAFYSSLENIEIQQITDFLKRQGIKDLNQFDEKMKNFVKFQFIFDYQDNKKIINALNRVYKKVGIEYTLENEDETLILKHLPDIIFMQQNHIETLRKILN